MADKVSQCLTKWWPGILQSDSEEMNRCIGSLEARFKRPYTTAEKCFGNGARRECGGVVRSDASCTVEGGNFTQWFSDNTGLAKECAEKLRALGYNATTKLVPRRWIADAVQVLVAK